MGPGGAAPALTGTPRPGGTVPMGAATGIGPEAPPAPPAIIACPPACWLPPPPCAARSPRCHAELTTTHRPSSANVPCAMAAEAVAAWAKVMKAKPRFCPLARSIGTYTSSTGPRPWKKARMVPAEVRRWRERGMGAELAPGARTLAGLEPDLAHEDAFALARPRCAGRSAHWVAELGVRCSRHRLPVIGRCEAGLEAAVGSCGRVRRCRREGIRARWGNVRRVGRLRKPRLRLGRRPALGHGLRHHNLLPAERVRAPLVHASRAGRVRERHEGVALVRRLRVPPTPRNEAVLQRPELRKVVAKVGWRRAR